MNAQLFKEFRLLRPALATALLLAVVPGVVLAWEQDVDVTMVAFACFCFGVLLLALSAFGREFSGNTFGLFLSQPLERSRLWWTKVGALAGAVLLVLAAWSVTILSWSYVNDEWGWGESKLFKQLTGFGAIASLVLFSGGLWTTLLLRQVAAAFWFTLLIPICVLMLFSIRDLPPGWVYAALGFYSAVGFAWAWWYFNRIQEVGWTGGEISLPARSGRAARQAGGRKRGAFAALARKEFQLHQISLIGVAGLFIVHLGVIALRHFDRENLPDLIRTASEVFTGIWFIVPLIISATAISEERKLNTLETLLTLPISRFRQFLTKLAVVLILGGIVSGFLPWVAEGIGSSWGAPADIAAFKNPFDIEMLFIFWMIALSMTLIGFFASSLSRSVIQALAASIVCVIVLWALGALSLRPKIFGYVPWSGFLGELIFVPTFIFIIVRLAWHNYRTVSGTAQMLYKNLSTFAYGIVFVGVITACLYNRVWEYLTPLEKPHGPAILGTPSPITANSQRFGSMTVLFDSGKLWAGRIGARPGKIKFAFFNYALSEGAAAFNVVVGGSIPGNDWVDATSTMLDFAAIRRDGTLWVSARPSQFYAGEASETPTPTYSKLIQLGEDKNWKSVIAEQGWSVVLLKTDGTLWRLGGIPRPSAQNSYLGLHASVPHQIGHNSDWETVMHGASRIYLWKKDGSAWGLNFAGANENASEESLHFERLTALDHTRWKALAPYFDYQVGLREDGTLWAWKAWPGYVPRAGKALVFNPTPERIGSETNWVALTGSYISMAAIKSDGSLWRWDAGYPYSEPSDSLQNPPARLGSHADWVGVAGILDGIGSVAADGSIWYWMRREPISGTLEPDQMLLARSRKPVRMGEIGK